MKILSILFLSLVLLISTAPCLHAQTSDLNKMSGMDGKSGYDLSAVFGKTLFDKTGKEVSAISMKGKIIGIYFSAHWCPPCRRFSPILVNTYNELKRAGKAFEIVFVSSDRSADGMYKYMKELKMPWLAMKHGSEFGASLKRKYGLRGIPSLIIVGPDGSLITKEGRAAISQKGAKALSEW